jgi:hypothetical protein
MDYGIYAVNSNVIVRNNHFQNLTGPTLFSRNMINYGVGVYGINDALNQSKRIEVGANKSRNSFYDCNRGVDLNGYYHCEVKGNCFQSTIAYSPGSGTQSPVGNYAAFVKSGRYIFTDIVNNTVTNWAQGLVFFSEYLLNPSGVYTRMEGDMYIRNNTISPGASFTTQYVGTAIIAESLSMNCTGCSSTIVGQTYVQDNTITNAYNGIRIQGWARRSFTRDNTITIRYQPNFGPLPTIFQQAGIRVISNADPVVFRNHIFGNMATGNTAAKLQLRGIYCTINNGMRVRCNDMTDVGQCMVFQGSNIGDVWDNIMNNATDGLVLINGGIIGHQTFNSQNTGIPSANIWNGPFAGDHTFVDANSFASNSRLYVTPGSQSSLPTTQPFDNGGPAGNRYTSATIITVSGPNPRNCNGNFIVQNNNGQGTRQLLRAIVQDSAPVAGYVAEEKWMNKQQVYEMLREDNSLMVGEPVLQQFYATTPATGIGKVATTDEHMLQTNIAAASATNQSITPVVLPEQNYQDVNAIYIDILADSIVDSTQYQTLETIAAQCPVQGGIAVFRARTLLQMLDDNVRTWEDSCDTGSSARLMQDEEDPIAAQAQHILLYPNPNDGNMVLQYTLPEGQQGQFIIYDLMGNIVDTETLAPGTQTQSILMSGLAAGIYFYQVTFDNQIIKSDKIVIRK